MTDNKKANIKLEKQMLRKTAKAITQYNMIEDDYLNDGEEDYKEVLIVINTDEECKEEHQNNSQPIPFKPT